MAKIRAKLGSVNPADYEHTEPKALSLPAVIERLNNIKAKNYSKVESFYRLWSEARRAVYKTHEWKTFRKQVLHRSKGVCEGCKSEKATEIHHIVRVYDDPSLVVTLKNVRHVCKTCHELVHGRIFEHFD